MIAICREVDRNSGQIAVYPLKAEVTDNLLHILSIRARLNPELRYFVVTKGHFDQNESFITGMLKRKTLSPKTVKSIGGVVEL